jgi:hypothetical protein
MPKNRRRESPRNYIKLKGVDSNIKTSPSGGNSNNKKFNEKRRDYEERTRREEEFEGNLRVVIGIMCIAIIIGFILVVP